MSARMKNPAYLMPTAMKGIGSLLQAVEASGLPVGVRELAGLRVSQINGCGACVYGHVHQARKAGESDERVANVAAWREAPFYSDAERAALALAETATRLADRTGDGVPDEIWDDVADHFDEQQLAGLILTIALTNLFNRVNVTIKEPAGTMW